jgi:hypothetical protein
MAGYDPRLDPNLQAALAANGSQYAPFPNGAPPQTLADVQAGPPGGYDPRSDPYLQQALAMSGGAPAPQGMPAPAQTLEDLYAAQAAGPAPAPQPDLTLAQQIAQMNAPGATAPTAFAGSPQEFRGAQREATDPASAYKSVPVSQLRGQPQQDEGDGYRMPDLAQMGQRGGGGAAPSQAKAKMDGAFGGMTDAITQRQDAAREIADTRAGVGRSMADIRDNANVDDEMYAQRMADEAERHQGAVDAVQARQREDAEFIRTFEPSDRRSTGRVAMSSIAVALSGIGDAIAMGGGNANPGHLKTTLGIIDRSIDRDLEYQREMISNKRTALAASNTELGQMRERYGDNLDAMKMARVVKLDQYQRAIDTAIQQGASAEAVTAGKDTQAQLELQKQQLMYEVYGAQYQAEMRARAGGGAMGQLKLQEQMLKNEKLRGELGGGKGSAQDVPGYKRTKDVAPAQVTEANKAAGAAASLNASLDQLAKMRDEYAKTSVVDVAKRDALAKRARQLIGNYADTASQLAGGGQAGEAAKQQAMQDIPDPTQWSLPGRADPAAVYKGLKQQNAQQAAARLRALGYEPERVTEADLDLRSE